MRISVSLAETRPEIIKNSNYTVFLREFIFTLRFCVFFLPDYDITSFYVASTAPPFNLFLNTDTVRFFQKNNFQHNSHKIT